MFKVKTPRFTKRTFKGIGQLPKRFKVLRDLVPWLTALSVRDAVKANVPLTPQWKAYREGLDVVRVGSPRKPTFAVQVSGTKASQVKKIDAPVSLLYIRGHKRLVRVSPTMQVLIKYSPWTLDTLPFMPSKQEAIVTSRRTTRQAALRVSIQRKRDRPFWSRELAKAGRRQARRKDMPKLTKRAAKPVTDLMGLVIRLEFGIGIKPRPHWRPAIMPFVRDRQEIFRRRPELLDIFDLSFRGWKSLRSRVKNTISRSTAQKFLPFQTRLGL